MMLSIFARNFEEEREEVLSDNSLSEKERKEFLKEVETSEKFKNSLLSLEIKLSQHDFSKEEIRKDFDNIFDSFKEFRYVDDDYFIQKSEGENENLSFEEYKDDLFAIISDDKVSLRDIF